MEYFYIKFDTCIVFIWIKMYYRCHLFNLLLLTVSTARKKKEVEINSYTFMHFTLRLCSKLKIKYHIYYLTYSFYYAVFRINNKLQNE